MSIRITIIGLLLCLGSQLLGSEVVKVGSSLQVIAISTEARHRWQNGERVCVYQDRRIVECGAIIKVTKMGAIVKLDAPSSYVTRGDMVRVERAAQAEREPSVRNNQDPDPAKRNVRQKVSSARSLRDREPEPPLEQESEPPPDDEERQPRQRKPATQLLESQHKVDGVQTPTFNLSGGISAGFTFFFPMIHFQTMIGQYFSLGIEPLFFQASTDTSSVGAYGGLVTLNYYGNEFFRGFWAQLGAGTYHMYASTTIGTNIADEEANCPAGIVTVGWRGYWDLGLNVGVAAGVQYVNDPGFQAVAVKAFDFQPIFQLDVGISF